MLRPGSVVVVLAALMAAGCSAAPERRADNTPAICADYATLPEQMLKDSPEGHAVNDAEEKESNGTVDHATYEAAVTKFYKAYGARLKALAGRATNPAVKGALTTLSKSNAAGRPGTDGMSTMGELCPRPTPSPE